MEQYWLDAVSELLWLIDALGAALFALCIGMAMIAARLGDRSK